MNKVTAIVLAGGSSTRFKENKMLYNIDNESVIKKSVSVFYNLKEITDIVVVCNKDFLDELKNELKDFSNLKFVLGGKTRFHSVLNGLNEITDTDIVVIHDGARPFIKQDTIKKSIESATLYGSGIVCVKTTDSVYKASDNKIEEVLERDSLVNIQTPQAFRFSEILSAYKKCDTENNFTDDSAIYLKYIGKPHIVLGEYSNKKITVKDDVEKMKDFRIGNGYDIHKLVENRKLILGGVQIDYELGLLGHSDADVLIHSIMDALLSASGLRDIGYYFSDKDARFLDIDSTLLLKEVLKMVQEKGFSINNITATVIAQKPKLKAYHEKIVESLSTLLNIEKEKVGITFNTKEGLDSVGEGKAIEVMSSALLYR